MSNPLLFMLKSLTLWNGSSQPTCILISPTAAQLGSKVRLNILATEHQMRKLDYTFREVIVLISYCMVRAWKTGHITLYMILSFTVTFKFNVQSNMQCRKHRSMSKLLTENNHKALNIQYQDKKTPPEMSNIKYF
jgi:hypothetical protein